MPDRMVATYPKDRRARREAIRARRRLRARWWVQYDLAYDGGGSRWKGYYRTQIGARVSIFMNLYMCSWGGSAVLYQKGD